jgi:hypothetical protein
MDKVRLRKVLVAAVLCLLGTGCGTISIGVSNSADVCSNTSNPAQCR